MESEFGGTMRISPFQTFMLFISLKNHFLKEDYDYFKYNGKSNVSKKSFDKRSDKYVFEKINNRYISKEITERFFVANLVQGVTWIRDFNDSNYNKMMRYRQSMSYSFSGDCRTLFNGVDPPDVFKTPKDSYPLILTYFLEDQISIETLVIINRLTMFKERFDERIGTNDYVWSKIRLKMDKYSPFLKYNDKYLRDIFKQHTFPF